VHIICGDNGICMGRRYWEIYVDGVVRSLWQYQAWSKVKLNRSQAVNVQKLLTIRYLSTGRGTVPDIVGQPREHCLPALECARTVCKY